MKNYFLSAAAFLALTASLSAADSGLYVGLGYANTNIDLAFDGHNVDKDLLNLSTDSIVLLAGYDFNQYLGVEGRYYLNASEAAYENKFNGTLLSGKYKAESFALYAKPQYKFAMLNFYALLGVTANDYTANTLLGGNNNDTLFTWGAGIKFNLTDSLGAFVDYTNLGESDNVLTNTDLDSWNIGFSYKF
jgi:opacity protein-like surface antigen